MRDASSAARSVQDQAVPREEDGGGCGAQSPPQQRLPPSDDSDSSSDEEEGEPEDGDIIVNPGVKKLSKYAKAIKVNAQEYATKSTKEDRIAFVNVSDDDHMNPILLVSMIC